MPARSRAARTAYVRLLRRRASLPDVPGVPHGPTPVRRCAPVGAGAARSRQRKAEARRERDAEIRALLEAALEKLREQP
jgi:hypothetical protein